MRASVSIALVGLVIAGLVACSTSGDAPPPLDRGAPALCAPGRQARCTCNNGLSAGFVNCNAEGTGYEGRCSCEAGGLTPDGGSETVVPDGGAPVPAGPTAAERCTDLSSASSPIDLTTRNGWTATFAVDLVGAQSDTVSSFDLADGPDRVLRLRADRAGTAYVTVLGIEPPGTGNLDLILYARDACGATKEVGATSVKGSDIESYPFLSFPVQGGQDYFVFVDSRKGTGLTGINFKAELYDQ